MIGRTSEANAHILLRSQISQEKTSGRQTSSKDSMKRKIANAFIELVESRAPYECVTVVELANRVGVNRKTFYNHFESIDTLIFWIYRTAMLDVLNRPEFGNSFYAYPEASSYDPWPEWPYYVLANCETDENFESQMLYFKLIGEYFQSLRLYHEHIFQSSCYASLYDYIISLSIPAIKMDIRRLLNGRSIPDEVMSFLAEYHTMGIYGRVLYRYTKTHAFMMQEEIGPYMCYSHLMLRYTIENLCAQETMPDFFNHFKGLPGGLPYERDL